MLWHNEAIPVECERICDYVWEEAKETAELVLGVHGYAISKKDTSTITHSQPQGRSDSGLLPDRKLEELRVCAQGYLDYLSESESSC